MGNTLSSSLAEKPKYIKEWAISIKVQNRSFGSATPFLGADLSKTLAPVHMDACRIMFNSTIFRIGVKMGRELVKQMVVHPFSGMPITAKKNELKLININMEKILRYIK